MSENLQFRVKRKSDGLFLGSRTWGESHSKNGKFYAKRGFATAALKGAGESAKEHVLVTYQLTEIASEELS